MFVFAFVFAFIVVVVVNGKGEGDCAEDEGGAGMGGRDVEVEGTEEKLFPGTNSLNPFTASREFLFPFPFPPTVPPLG